MPFIPGLELSRSFFEDLVEPLIGRRFPSLQYAAGLLGHCSDVLGFDDATSTDHVWGPRLQIFLADADHLRIARELDQVLSRELPPTHRGFPIHYQSEPGFFRWARLEYRAEPPFNHFIEIVTVRSFFNRDIQWDTCREPTIDEWLTFTDQALVELTSGQVFRDDHGELSRARQWLSFFPEPVWLFRMFCLWHSIAEEQAFVGRCHQVGDELGWRLIATRIVNKAMKLCFYQEHKYFPYSKWFGSAFKKLSCAHVLEALIQSALLAGSYQCAEDALCAVLLKVGEMHNTFAVTDPVEARIIDCYKRGFHCMDAEPFCNALKKRLDGSVLNGMDWDLLSKTVLCDDSNVGNSSGANRTIVDAARRIRTSSSLA